ncbi:MAG: polysaccharide pyruvyl transferase family protein [Pseudomonadota bacterium]
MNIGLITGFWSTNIGNAFFHLGADFILRHLANESDRIIWLNNMPAYWRLFNKKNPAFGVRGIGEPSLDVLVMVGPFLRRAFPEIWKDELIRLQNSGTRIVMLGLGSMQHDLETKKLCREFFKDLRPQFISTRDQATYDTLADLGLNIERVICPAFFINHAVKKPIGNVPDYLVVNCEKVVEPELKTKNSSESTGNTLSVSINNVSFDIIYDTVPSNRYLERFAELTLNLKYLFSRGGESSISGIDIYRTVHRSNPFIFREMFSRPNTMVSDVPHPYLLAYANAKLIITDRVHTAVAGVAYGVPVIFVGRTKRQGLLSAAGINIEACGTLCVDQEVLEAEKLRLLNLVSINVFGKNINS